MKIRYLYHFFCYIYLLVFTVMFYFLDPIAEKVPDHEKVEPHEQSQHSPTVRHQGAQGVCQLLCLCQNVATVKHYLNLGHILYIHVDRITNELKCMCRYLEANKLEF